MPVTIKDIANYFSLHVSTVSRALRNDPTIKLETQKMIREKAKELGYRINQSARSLVTGKTSIIYLLLPSLRNRIELNPGDSASFFAEKNGFDLLAAVYHNQRSTYERLLTKFGPGVADGALVIPNFPMDEKIRNEIEKSEKAILFIDRFYSDIDAPWVTSDNYQGASDLIQKAVSEGGDYFVLYFPTINDVIRDRLQGTLETLKKLNIPFIDLSSDSPNFSIPSHHRSPVLLANSYFDLDYLKTHILKNKNENHQMIYAIYDYWPGQIPEKSIVLSAIQDFEKMGETACRILIEIINQKRKRNYEKIMVPFKTIERLSAPFTD